MDFLEFTFGLIFLGSCGGVIITVVDRIFGNKGKAHAAELSAAGDRIRTLELQLVTAHSQNDQLEKQLDWHAKLLDTQDRMMKQLANGQAHAAAVPAMS